MWQNSSIAYEFLPDHQAFLQMLVRYLPLAEATEAILSTEGYVPVAIDPEGRGRIFWADLQQRPLREWQHLYTVRNAITEGAVKAFYTDMDILLDDRLADEAVPIRGLIFHISRCGSTLLGKCLAACPEHLVINQGGPLQRGFWAWATKDFRREMPTSKPYQSMLKRLIGAMARRRGGSYQAAFVKFISWNSLYIDFIRSSFPGVPALFMYRDPVEVIAAVQAETTAVLLARGTPQARLLTGLSPEETAKMNDVEYLTHCYANYFRHALCAKKLPLLNYREMKRENFQDIVRVGLDLKPKHNQVLLMQRQFNVHSKDDTGSAAFVEDVAKKQLSITETNRVIIREKLGSLYERLEGSSVNVNRLVEGGVTV